MQAAKRIMDTTTWIRAEIEKMTDLQVLGDSLFLIAFASETLNIYQVMEDMTGKGWGLNGLHLPPQRSYLRDLAAYPAWRQGEIHRRPEFDH